MSQQHGAVTSAACMDSGTDVAGPVDGLVVEGLTKRFKGFTLAPHLPAGAPSWAAPGNVRHPTQVGHAWRVVPDRQGA